MTEISIERLVLLFCVLKCVLCLPQFHNHYNNPRHLQGPTFHWGSNDQRSPINHRQQREHHRHEGMCRDFEPTPSIAHPVEVNNENQFQSPTFNPERINSPPPNSPLMIVIGQQLPDAPDAPPIIQLGQKPRNGMCRKEEMVTHRYHKQSGTCQRLGERGVCRSLMVLYSDANNITGNCDCKSHNGNTLRPLVYWPATDQCYHLYEQGPCSAGKWLVDQIGSLQAVCTKRSCPQNPESEYKYWFTHQGMCFQADTSNEDTREFCKSNTQKLYHVEEYEIQNNRGYVRCLEKPPALPMPMTRNLVGSAKDLPCKPGHKKSLNGECNRVAKFI